MSLFKDEHYRVIARVLGTARQEEKAPEWEKIVEVLSIAFLMDNPRFNPRAFEALCRRAFLMKSKQ